MLHSSLRRVEYRLRFPHGSLIKPVLLKEEVAHLQNKPQVISLFMCHVFQPVTLEGIFAQSRKYQVKALHIELHLEKNKSE